MRRSIVPLAITVLALAGAVIGWKIYWPTESGRYAATKAVLATRSEVRMVFAVGRERGPISREELTFTNADGSAKVAYVGTNRAGTTIARFAATVDGYDVATLFGKVVQDGIWELPTKPSRGDTSTTYSISVYQLTDNQSGSHAFSFTDPHYWATTGGRQYQIHLDKNKPVPDLVKLLSTSSTEPRYENLVADFETFGSPGFRATLAAARAKLRSA
jgi:hypothetical protein